jgi:hypothetical protein
LVAILLSAYAVVVPVVVGGGLALPLPGRVAIALGITLPLAAALGTALPIGLQELRGHGGAAVVPWAWGVNGAASVVGTTLATMLAMDAGNAVVLLAAAALYVVAAVCLWVTTRQSRRTADSGRCGLREG